MKTSTIQVTLFGMLNIKSILKAFELSRSQRNCPVWLMNQFSYAIAYVSFSTPVCKSVLRPLGATFLFHLRKLYPRRCISFSLDSMYSIRSTSHKIQKCNLLLLSPARKALTQAFSLIIFLPLTEGPPLREQAAEPRNQFLP